MTEKIDIFVKICNNLNLFDKVSVKAYVFCRNKKKLLDKKTTFKP